MKRFLFAAGLALVSTACKMESTQKLAPNPSIKPEVTVEPRSQFLPAYPCSGCHADMVPKPKRYDLQEFHAVRNAEFSHGEDAFWCYQCHSLINIDRLVTSAGQMVTFDEAYKICTSCHGDKLADWRSGIHGVARGYWTGKKRRLSCPACHDPHDPRYPKIVPEPPPAPVREVSPL